MPVLILINHKLYMNQFQAKPPTMQALTRLAFQFDKRLGTETFTPLYRRHTFRPDTVNAQTFSKFLRLPTEIRLIIYEFVFTPHNSPCVSCPRANPLSLLLTCRTIHSEALTPALRRTHFHLSYPHNLAFQSTLRSLGPLKNQLRYIHVSIPIHALNAYSTSNPFLLTELPLHELVVELGRIDAPTWMDENTAYHRLVSAMFWRALACPDSNDSPIALHASLYERTKRKISIMLLSEWASAAHLHQFIGGMKCRKVVVQADRDERDVLWSAMVHFGLVEECMTVLEEEGEGKGKKRMYVICGDEGEKSFVEWGVWPPRGWEGE